MVSPNSLSPSQRETLADQVGPGNGIMKAIMSVATNPLFLVGALLAFKHPLPTAANIFKTAKGFGAYTRKTAPLFRWLNSSWDNYRGTTIPQLMHHSAMQIQWTNHFHMTPVSHAITAWEKAMGRKFDGSVENILVHAKLGGLDRVVTRDLKKVVTKRGAIVDIKRIPKTYQPLFKPIQLDPLAQRIHDVIRKSYEQQWENMTDNPLALAQGIRSMRKGDLRIGDPDRVFFEGLFDGNTLNSILKAKHLTLSKLEKVLTEYFEKDPAYHPRYRVGGEDAFANRVAQARSEGKNGVNAVKAVMDETLERELVRAGVGSKTRARVRAAAAPHTANPSLYARQNTTLWDNYDPEALARVRDHLIDKDLPERNRRRITHIREAGKDTHSTPFTMNAQRAWEEYTNRAAVTKTLYLDRVPDWIVKMNKELADTPKVPLEENMSIGMAFRAEYESIPSEALRRDLADIWLPTVKGQLTVPQFNQRLFWSGIKKRFGEALDGGSPDPSKPAGVIGPLLQKTLGEKGYENFRLHLEKVPRGQIGTSLASWLYTGALGLSPGAAFQNMFQTYLTTSQFLPFKHVMTGQLKALSSLRSYAADRLGGMPSREAAGRSFQSLINIGQELDPRFTRGLAASLEGSFQAGLSSVQGIKSKAEQLQNISMAMFTTSERFVRLTAAYGAESFAAASGIATGSSESLNFINQVVQRTQFSAGVSNIPRALVNLPAPLKQFVKFPLSLATTLTSASPYVGGGAPRALSGGLGRALVGSTAIFEAGRALFDVDTDRMLLFGGLPLPEPDGPLAPFPFVPPAVGAAASGVQALVGGDPTQLRYALTPFIPGGVSLAKVAPFAAPGVAEQLGLAHIDWNNPLNGQFPYYSQTGALVGYFSKEQLALKAMGLDNTGTQREGDVLHYLTAQRDKIRATRRSYAEALWASEFDKAQKIEHEWSRNWPEMGPITVSKTDYQNLQTRLTMTRMERAIQTLPPDLRPIFSAAVAAGLTPRFAGMFGLDAQMLGASVSNRNAARPRGPITQQRGLYGGGGSGVNQQAPPSGTPFVGFRGFQSPMDTTDQIPLY